MKSYKYLALGDPNVTVECTDEQVLEWVVSLVKKVIPSCDHYYYSPAGKDRTYLKKYRVQISKLEDKDIEVRWWLMEQLGQQGWEPFQVGAIWMYFRLEVEKEDKVN